MGRIRALWILNLRLLDRLYIRNLMLQSKRIIYPSRSVKVGKKYFEIWFTEVYCNNIYDETNRKIWRLLPSEM